MEQEKQTICGRLSSIMYEAKAIGKDSRNQEQRFNFRGIDAVMNHLHPIFAKHGVVILPEVLEERTEERQTRSGGNLIYRILRIKFRFVAADGSEMSCVVMGEGMDTGDKGANKAMAVGLKYALTQMLLLPYDEVDPDAESHPPSEPKPEPPMSAPAHGDGEHVAVLKLGEVLTKEGSSAKGPWCRWYTKADDGEFYSTFDTKLGEVLETLGGERVQMTYTVKTTPKGEQRTIVAVEPEINGAQEQAKHDENRAQEQDNLPF